VANSIKFKNKALPIANCALLIVSQGDQIITPAIQLAMRNMQWAMEFSAANAGGGLNSIGLQAAKRFFILSSPA
jgi:hypothetical protein